MTPVLQHGIIAGGLADGSIALWDAHQLLRGRSETAQLALETKHHGAVSPAPTALHHTKASVAAVLSTASNAACD